MSWCDRRLFAISQAGLVEKFVDALVWALFPVFLVTQGATLTEVGWIVGVYGFVWGGSQLFTGRLSDHVGRLGPKVLGVWICGAGVAMVVGVGGCRGVRHGAALPEPLGSRGGHHAMIEKCHAFAAVGWPVERFSADPECRLTTVYIIVISILARAYCRCSLPMFHPQLALLLQIKGFGRHIGNESCGEDSMVLPRTGSGPGESESVLRVL